MSRKARRRDGAKEARWREVIEAAGRSGLTIREFCRRHRLKESQFYWWQRNLRARQEPQTLTLQERTGGRADPPVSFALVSEASFELAAGGLELVLCDGRRLRIGQGVDAATLRTVLDVLEEETDRSPGETGSFRC